MFGQEEIYSMKTAEYRVSPGIAPDIEKWCYNQFGVPSTMGTPADEYTWSMYVYANQCRIRMLFINDEQFNWFTLRWSQNLCIV